VADTTPVPLKNPPQSGIITLKEKEVMLSPAKAIDILPSLAPLLQQVVKLDVAKKPPDKNLCCGSAVNLAEIG
jgi:hypothetical protein